MTTIDRLQTDIDEEPTGKPLKLSRPRAALIAYQVHGSCVRYLLVSARNNPSKLTLPGGKIGKCELAVRAAQREAAEEAGVLVDSPHKLGQYLHRKAGQRYHPTQTFLGQYAGQLADYETRALYWLTLDEISTSHAKQIRKPVREQLYRAAMAVRQRIVGVSTISQHA